jgi:DNA-binding protein
LLIKRNKYGNKKVEVDGIKFDSKLELYLYNKLKENDLDFDFQAKEVLIPKFRFRIENIRAIEMRVDFLLRFNERKIYIDTKGFATAEAKIKYKMLKNKYKEDVDVEVIWLKTQKEVNSFIISLNTGI